MLTLFGVEAGNAAFAEDIRHEATSGFDFSYAPEGAELSAIGCGRYVVTDVAVKLADPALWGSGTAITGISFLIPAEGGTCAPEVSAWLASDLLTDDEGVEIMTDLAFGTSVIPSAPEADGFYHVRVDFDQPYRPEYLPIYAGYTVKVESLHQWTQKYPVVVAPRKDAYASGNGLFLHTGYRYTSWTDLRSRGEVAAMKVHFSGQPAYGGLEVKPGRNVVYGIPGEETSFFANLTNRSGREISQLNYRLGNEPGLGEEKTFVLPEPLPAYFGASMDVEIPFIPESAGSGEIIMTLTDPQPGPEWNTISFYADIRDWLPHHRPLVEEYTGLWCGGCPAAWVAVNQEKDLRGDDFVCITYHANDQLMTTDFNSLPEVGGFPMLLIDRTTRVSDHSLFDKTWRMRQSGMAPADINVDIEWTDDGRTALRAKSTLRFLDSHSDHRFQLAYALVEDEMSDPSWGQRNYFWQDEPSDDPYWRFFKGTTYEVKGIVYDDVALETPYPNGIEDSLPETLEADTEYTHEFEFALSDAKCTYVASPMMGQNIIRDPGKLRVVAMLIARDKYQDGEDVEYGGKYIANCNTSGYSADAVVANADPAGINEVGNEDPSKSWENTATSRENDEATEYYDLMGRRLEAPLAKGLTITLRRGENGEPVTAKQVQ